MRTAIFSFTILAIMSIYIGCKKEDINIDIKSNNWELVKIKKQGESSYTRAKGVYVIEFVSDTTYTLNLDVNSCGGHYEIANSGIITISLMGCTKVCCDSDFAEELLQLFPKMTKYYGKGNDLIFEGDGEMIFERQ